MIDKTGREREGEILGERVGERVGEILGEILGERVGEILGEILGEGRGERKRESWGYIHGGREGAVCLSPSGRWPCHGSGPLSYFSLKLNV